MNSDWAAAMAAARSEEYRRSSTEATAAVLVGQTRPHPHRTAGSATNMRRIHRRDLFATPPNATPPARQ